MAETTDPADVAKIITVTDGLWVRQAIDSITWIDLGDCGLVVDALEEGHLADEVFEAIGSTLGDKPIRYLINTHTHYDHVALNAAFVKRWETEIVNAQTCEIPPKGRWFEGPARRVQVLHMPGCHTAEDLVIWAPDDRALLVGDIFCWGVIPLVRNLTDETGQLLADTYARLIAFEPTTVIPGHGPLCTAAELARFIEYLGWLGEQATQGLAAGKDADAIAAEIAPPEDMKSWWRFLLWKHEDSVAKVVKAVSKGWRGFS